MLVNGANADILRIFCASHVIDEVFEHSRRWASDLGVEPSAFVAVWLREYVPLIREIRAGDLDGSWFTPLERERLDRLDRADPDDRPSAELALALRAQFLTKDRRALQASYGPTVDVEAQSEWLPPLRAGGDAAELEHILAGIHVTAALAGSGLYALSRWAAKTVPILLVGGAVAAAHHGMEPWRRVGRAALIAAQVLSHVSAEYKLRVETTAAVVVPVPDDIARLPISAAQARRCASELASGPGRRASATELSVRLAGQGDCIPDGTIRRTLRAFDVFHEVSPGRFGVGHPVDLERSERR